MHDLTVSPSRRVTLVFLLCILLVAALPAHARDITVEGDCSLRDAIKAANDNKKVDGCVAGSGPGDTIILTDHVVLRRSVPTITSDITLEGNGRMVEFGDHPAFIVDDATLILKNLHVRFHGLRTGGVLEIEDGSLTLANTVFHDCTGGINAKDSTIELLGNSIICGHARNIIDAWFGILPPQPNTCESLTGARVTATQGLGSGVQCQQVDAAGVGNQSVIDAGLH